MKWFYRIFFLLAVSVIMVSVLPVLAQTSVTFTVNSANDVDDGICNAAHCSLREAINASNQNHSGGYYANLINFNIAGTGLHTIQPTTPLPTIIHDVTIDATTQPGYAAGAPVIELNGSNLVTALHEDKVGFHVSLSEQYPAIIRGFVINGFAYAGVMIERARFYEIQTNFIGTNAVGTTAVPNGYGVVLRNTYTTYVGGWDPGQGNVISGNSNDGINIQNNDPLHSSGSNRILGNYIGLNAAGTAALGNDGNGIYIDSASGTMIGSTPESNGRNIISGNGSNGIHLKNLVNQYSMVEKNYIGTDVSGIVLIGNGLNGILLEDTSGIHIGDALRGNTGNIIAGNGQNGIRIVGAASTPNELSWNTIFDNGALGIELGSDGVTLNDTFDADNGPNTLQNFPVLTKVIASDRGSTIFGTLHSKPNTHYVVDFYANPSCNPSGYGEGKTMIGYTFLTTDAAGNAAFTVRTWDTTPGYFITATASMIDMPTSRFGSHDMSEFSACTVALDATHHVLSLTVNTTADTDDGVCDAANCSFREAINQAETIVGHDTIRFNIPGKGPHTITISSMLGSMLPQKIYSGLFIDGTSQPGYSGKPLIAIAGSNSYNCSLRIESSFNKIRGLLMYGDCAINIIGNDNIIQGNYFGTDFSGLSITSVRDGGIQISGSRNLIGGTNTADRNLILARRYRQGFVVGGDHNVIQGNYVGVDITGKVVMGYTLSGIAVGGNDNLVGGTVPGAGNIVAGAELDGVDVTIGHGNAILGNSIMMNNHNGIGLDNDIHSDILNDAGDTDDGPNGFQNAPQLTMALKSEAGLSVTGTLKSQPDKQYHIEFFANPSCSVWGYGEGQIYLGTGSAITDNNGNAVFTIEISGSAPEWYSVTSTATDPDNNTSEFSACTPLIDADSAPIHDYYRTRVVTLSWEGVSWALGYSVQVYLDPDVSNFPYNYTGGGWVDMNERSITVTVPNFDSLYYWRVGAVNADGSIQWSETQSFRVDIP